MMIKIQNQGKPSDIKVTPEISPLVSFPVVTQSTTTLVPNLEPFGTKGT